MASKSKKYRAKRRWWQVLCRVCIAAAILLIGAYVTFPWWAPRQAIRDYIAADLSRQLGVDVRIKSLDLSWGGGITLNNLTITSGRQFGAVPMVTVDRINADYSPSDIILRKRIAWADVSGARVSSVFDTDGNCNLDVLKRLDISIQTDRVSIHGAVVTVDFPKSDKALQLDIGDMQIAAGRLDRLGSVTMSARLAQEGQSAPLHLRLAGGIDETSGGTATFAFADIDLSQVNIPKIMGLPLQKLAGRCSGSLDLRITRQGVADRFGINVQIKGLDVQPIRGPQMPVIDEAGLRIAATIDPLADGGAKVNVQSLGVRLPGLDLAGQMVIQGDPHDIDLGAIRSFDIYGEVKPTQLATLLRGGPRPAGAFGVEGPVALGLSGQRSGERLNFRLGVDGTKATIVNGGATIKPADRLAKLNFTGGVDQNLRSLWAEHGEITLGGDRLTFHGSTDKLDQLMRRNTDGEVRSDCGLRIADCGLNSNNDENIPEIRATLNAQRWGCDVGATNRAASVSASDTPTGEYNETQDGNRPGNFESRIDFSEPGRTANRELNNKNDNNKNTGKMPVLLMGETPMPQSRPVRKVMDALACINLAAVVEIRDLYSLRDLSPELARALVPMTLDNVITGHLNIEKENGGTIIEADLRVPAESNFAVAGRFVKPRDQAITLNASAQIEPAADGFGDIDIDVNVGQGRFSIEHAQVIFEGAANSTIRASGRFNAAKVGELIKPFGIDEAGITADGGIDGKFDMLLAGDKKSLMLRGDLDKLMVSVGEFFRKTAGNSATLEIQLADNGLAASERFTASLDMDSPTLHIVGKAAVPSGDAPTTTAANVEVKDAAGLVAMSPMLSELLRDQRISGRLSIDATASHTAFANEFVASINLYGAEFVGGTAKCPLQKPKDAPARINLKAAATADFSSIGFSELSLNLGDLKVRADAMADLSRAPGNIRLGSLTSAHVTLETTNARSLETFSPTLQQRQLTGDARMELTFRNSPLADVRRFMCDGGLAWTNGFGMGISRIGSLTFSSKNLAATVNGKIVATAGAFRVDDINVGRSLSAITVGHFRTDMLELAVGQNHGWLVADIESPVTKPTGTFDGIFDYLSEMDLNAWLSSGEFAPKNKPEMIGPPLPPKLQAERLLEKYTPIATAANITGHLRIDHFQRFDAVVEQTYDPYCIDLDLSLAAGRLKCTYQAGLNGGNYFTDLETLLTNAQPQARLTNRLRDVIAKENMQPQLALFFPGNTVYGTISRTTDETMFLADLLAQQLDPHYPLHTKGTGVTVTTDGLLEGQAAPKFVTAIFPGLNLTQYRYKTMTAFATMIGDGSIDNDMIFDGATYDTYITGSTAADNWGQYEIGLILLGSPQSAEFNHQSHLGRLLLLKLKARIEGGHLYDLDVAYPWPTDAVGAMLIRNNSLVQVWRNQKK